MQQPTVESTRHLLRGDAEFVLAGTAPWQTIVQVDDTPTAIGRFDDVTADLPGEWCGGRGLEVTHRDQLDAAMAELFATDGPALLCVEQDSELL